MQELFEAFVAHLERLGAAHHLADHNQHPTATEAQLAELAELAGPLPEDLAAWLRAADRSLPLAGAYATLAPGWILDRARSTSEMVAEGTFDPHLANIRSWRDGRWDDGRMREVYWSDGWVPVAEDGCGNQLCVDLSPGDRGTHGQIIAMEFQDGQGPYLSPWPNLRALILGHLRLLEQERLTLDEDQGIEYEWIEPPAIAELLSGS